MAFGIFLVIAAKLPHRIDRFRYAWWSNIRIILCKPFFHIFVHTRNSGGGGDGDDVDGPQKEIWRRHGKKLFMEIFLEWKACAFERTICNHTHRHTHTILVRIINMSVCEWIDGWMDVCLYVLHSYSSRFSFHFKEDSFIVRKRVRPHFLVRAFIIIFSSCPDNLAVNAKCM